MNRFQVAWGMAEADDDADAEAKNIIVPTSDRIIN